MADTKRPPDLDLALRECEECRAEGDRRERLAADWWGRLTEVMRLMPRSRGRSLLAAVVREMGAEPKRGQRPQPAPQ